jgi:predicted Fe-Mo cluster-binding NifX family protein
MNMKAAISTVGESLDAEVDPRFGRCQNFIIIDPKTMQFEVLENPSAIASGGAGIATAQMIVGRGVNVVLTGNCGPNAHQALSSAGIQVITGLSGKVQDVVQGYQAGKYQASSEPNVSDHFGLGRRQGRGMGRGGGGGISRRQ